MNKQSEDKYYYFPTMTKNIMFIRGEKYICLSEYLGKVKKGQIYILDDFINGDPLKPLEFKDESGDIHRVSAFDCGSFISLKKFRLNKLTKLKQI